MKSKIFQRPDGSFTLQEYEEISGKKKQNKSVIPPKYSVKKIIQP